MSDARQRMRDRLKRLREMTTGRGCTEAEAMAAAEKAAALMAAHGYHDGDLEFEEAGSATRTGTRTIRLKLWSTIAHCTATAALVGRGARGSRIDFIGREPGPQIAAYLCEVCDRAIDREIATFKKGTFYRRRRSVATKRAAVADFTAGMVARMVIRLRAMFPDNSAARDAREAAWKERDRRYPNSESVSAPQHAGRYDEAQAAGYHAGGKVTLAHGVGSSAGAPLQIGGAS